MFSAHMAAGWKKETYIRPLLWQNSHPDCTFRKGCVHRTPSFGKVHHTQIAFHSCWTNSQTNHFPSPKSHIILVGLAPQQIFFNGWKGMHPPNPLLWEGSSPKSHFILVGLTPKQIFVGLTPLEPA